MAKTGPDQLLSFKLMLQEHLHGTLRNRGLIHAALCKQIQSKNFVLMSRLK